MPFIFTGIHCIIIKVDKEKTLFEQEIYHGSTVDLNLPLYGGNFTSSTNQIARNVVVTSKFILITVSQYADFDGGIILLSKYVL